MDRRTINIGDDEIVHLAGIGVTAESAQDQLTSSGFNVATGNISVLAHQRLAHIRDGNMVSSKAFSIDPDVDRALEIADYVHFADAARSLQLQSDREVRELSQLP